tara:strand:- start:9475 stop:9663 length:189 start_codon:yes stop_codon:yes gene_type:complete
MNEIIALNFKSTVLLLMNLGIEENYEIEINSIHTAFDNGDTKNALLYMSLLNEMIIEEFETI